AALPEPDALRALAAAANPPLVNAYEARLLAFAGLGSDPLGALHALSRTPTPALFEGERGTGKQWVAQLVHRLSGVPGPFVTREAEKEITLHGADPGTLLIERVHLVPPERHDELIRFARATGWKVLGTTR